MHWAAGYNVKVIVKLLLDRGADVMAMDRDDATPLHSAAESNNDPAVFELLLEHGVDVNARTIYGETPLMAAIYSNNALGTVIKLLIGPRAPTSRLVNTTAELR